MKSPKSPSDVPEHTEAAVPTNQATVNATRRRLIKQAAATAPVILTLRSGAAAALAQTSNACIQIVEEAPPPGGYLDELVNAEADVERYNCLDAVTTSYQNPTQSSGFFEKGGNGDPVRYRCGTDTQTGYIVTASSAASFGANQYCS